MAPRIGLATCAEFPHLDEDGRALLGALGRRGVEGAPAVWDDPEVDWAAFDLVLACWTWGYTTRRDAFLGWAEGLRRVANPAPVLRWNTDKAYLADLARAGVAVVETRVVAPGEPFVPPAGRFVVKPAVSTGAVDAASYRPGDPAGRAHVERLHAGGRTAVVQPYLAGVDEEGETDLVFVGGTYSHAARKAALLAAGRPPGEGFSLVEDVRAAEATPAELALAERALAAVPADPAALLYARVDVVPGPGGDPVVLEVELVEPSLFLPEAGPDALPRLVAAFTGA